MHIDGPSSGAFLVSINSGSSSAFRATGWLASLILAAATSVAGAATETPFGPETEVVRSTLDNGLHVIIVRNELAPVVSIAVNYLVGSDEAPAGFPGLAHAQEHMMFRGSPGLTADQLANIGAVMGGDFNADTRESITQYLFTVPADDLSVALHIEALRMKGVDDSVQGWDQERGAIEQEVAQDISNPSYKLYAQLRAIAFAGTPYAHDALGTRPSFDKTTAQQLQQFYSTWYAPNAAIMVIVGDIDPQTTLTQVRALFGDIPSKKLPPRPKVNLQPMRAASIKVDTDQPNGALMLALRVPGALSPDFPALEVLSDVLSSRRFALYGLVPQGKALDAGFSLDPLPQAGLAYAELEFTAGSDPKALEQEVRAILTKVAHQGVPPELVEAAKLQERRETSFAKNSIQGLASVWSDAVALYGLRSPDEDLERIERVTVADVNRVARQYLQLDQAVSAVMLPQGSGRPVPSSAGFGGQENIALGQGAATMLPDWAQKAEQTLTVPALKAHPTVTVLPNGLTLITQPEDVSDTVSVYGHIRNRPEMQAPVNQQGVDALLQQLLSFGTQRLDRVAFQEALDAIGADEQAGTDFGVQVLSQSFDRAVELLADNQLHPALPAEAMHILQGQLTQVVTARNQSPGYLAQRALRTALYPPDDPSQRDATPESMRSLTLQDVRAYQQRVFRPDLTTIVVIGKVTPAQAQATISKYFSGWSASGPKPAIDLPQAPPNRPGVIAVPDASRVQDTVVLAQDLALARSDPDYYALQLGSAVLGGGFYSTRLSVELRKDRGLVYTVGSQLQTGRTRGVYMIDYACDPQNVVKAAAIATQEVRSMQTAPASAVEMSRAKALLLRQIPLREASVNGIASGFLARVDVGLPLDEPVHAAHRYIDLSAEDVQAAFKKWIRPDDMVRVTRGPTPPGS